MNLRQRVNQGFNEISNSMGVPNSPLWYDGFYLVAAHKATKGRPWELIGEWSLDQATYHKQTINLMQQFLPSMLQGMKRHTMTESLTKLSSRPLKSVGETFNPNWALLYEIVSNMDPGPRQRRVIQKWKYSYFALMSRAWKYWKADKKKNLIGSFPEYFKNILSVLYYYPDRDEILEAFMHDNFKVKILEKILLSR